MLESAVRICGAEFGKLLLVEGDEFRHVAFHDVPASCLEGTHGAEQSSARGRALTIDRIMEHQGVVHVADIAAASGPPTAAI